MKKLRIDDLVVDSFTTSQGQGARGTVRGNDSELETFDLTCGCTVGPCEISDFGCGTGFHNTCSCGTCYGTCPDSCDPTFCLRDPCNTVDNYTCAANTSCC